MKTLLIGLGAFIIFFAGCKSQKPIAVSTCGGELLSFQKEIKAIIDNNCASSCHSAEYKSRSIDLTTYALVKQEAAQKRFMNSLNHVPGYAAMPLDHPKLSGEDLKKIGCWIEKGMQP